MDADRPAAAIGDALSAAIAQAGEGFAPPSETTLSGALLEVAERLRAAFDGDLAVIRVTAAEVGDEDVRVHSFRDLAHETVLSPAIHRLPAGVIGIARTALAVGHAVVWPDLLDEALAHSVADRLAPPERAQGLREILAGGSAIAIPLATPVDARLGAATVVSLDPDRRLGEAEREALEAIAPQVAVAVQSAVVADRTRRTRHTLLAVLDTTPNGIAVMDLHGRLLLANRAAGELLGTELVPHVGRSMPEMVADQIKWRFAQPEEMERRLAWLLEHPQESAQDELETIDGRVLERFSAPVRDSAEVLIGRVDIYSDVTEARTALAEARRLAEEKAALLEREERRAQEEVALTRAGHVMASALTRADIHEHLLSQAQRIAGADKSAVLVLDPPSGEILPVAASGFAEETLARMSFQRGEGVVGRVAESQRAFICNDAEADPRAVAAICRPEGIRSFMYVPVMLGERIYGVLNVNSRRPRAFGERELRVLTELARHAAAALQNAMQFEQERHIAETLQRSLLTEDLPSVPGLSFSALYRASAGSLVGGDTYSVWRLPGGEVAILVGDVSGKGVDAAGVTAMVRYMLEGLSLRERDPAVLLAELNRMLTVRLTDATLVTAFLAVLDAGLDVVRWCNAGHPPPLLLSRGEVIPLADPGPPCGAFGDAEYVQHTDPFAPGDLLFLYTDGLVEARRQGETFGEERLWRALQEVRGLAPAEVARSVFAAVRVWSQGLVADDVAIAVVARTGEPAGH